MDLFSATLNAYAADALAAFPAAVTRICLGWKAEPSIKFFASLQSKFSALLGSLSMAVMAGQLARSSPHTMGYAGLIIIFSAFNAQHIATRLIATSNANIKRAEKQVRDRIQKRIKDDER